MLGFAKRMWARHKVLTVLILIAFGVLIVFFSTKAFLYVKFLLGNDIIVKLESDKEDLFIVKGEEGLIKFKASVTTNPFCTAQCEYAFRDLSRDLYLDKNVSVLRPGNPLEKEYKLKVLMQGIGQDLYRFEMECNSVNTWLCHTEEDVTTRSMLITVNYDLNEEDKRLKEETKPVLESLTKRLETSIGKKARLDEAMILLNKTLNIERLEEESASINLMIARSEEDLLLFKDLFSQNKYSLASQGVAGLEQELEKTELSVENLTFNMESALASYNTLVENVSNVRNSLEKLRDNMVEDESFITSLNKTVEEFNHATKVLNEKTRLEEKEDALNNVSEKLNQLSATWQNLTSALPLSNSTVDSLEETYLGQVSLSETYNPISLGIIFEEPEPKCCLFKECKACCVSEDCKNSPDTYPVMLLHGHAVSEGISAEYSLEGFTKIQKMLEEDGYLNAGTVTLYTPQAGSQGLWGLSGTPVVVRSSYYFDVFQETPENYVVVQTKSESIDTYAIRLKELVDIVKYRTGKPKVNIVAFSMGGLVARRYLQVFGSQDVNKVILIGTPNSGIVGEVAKVCPLIGAELECRDLTEGSLFLNKLNRGQKPEIPVYTIVGTGCEMDGGIGDGIVLEDHSTIPWAENYIIQGVCSGKLNPLHLDLLKPDAYPEVHQLILKSLEP
ncbi:MAG: alpha/beta fold hydrolase [Nanoarchaeota archaeon]|nr:alpha/beta fold hydrolase [Nanoarchaeota archaeon]